MLTHPEPLTDTSLSVGSLDLSHSHLLSALRARYLFKAGLIWSSWPAVAPPSPTFDGTSNSDQIGSGPAEVTPGDPEDRGHQTRVKHTTNLPCTDWFHHSSTLPRAPSLLRLQLLGKPCAPCLFGSFARKLSFVDGRTTSAVASSAAFAPVILPGR